ncbi:chitin-binding protein [Stackebrandtia albiflava]|uniref:Chitin-binding protein n=1 Tax=Stackebrandtia albiflava TaxID=406432 RepID=A0A562VBQ8_9ACTN|nr:lytic polysaccharide monooxygenase [Stackebrandtia albiflava]TWJ15251.1 chitin-binding protein [Stackebrandtia albiflava]
MHRDISHPRIRRPLAASATAALVLGLTLVAAPGTADAHGVTMMPGSRTYLCWVDGLTDTGQIIPDNPACADAVDTTGTTPLYNWFAVLDSFGGGRTVGYIPDGELCSGGNNGPFDFSAYDAPRDDWPLTHLTASDTIQVQHSNWAAHPGAFHMYITKDGYDPLQPLGWDDLEPFWSVTDPPQSGGPGGSHYYYWDVDLPDDKSGRHLIYTHWVRSDSQENFYSCADVVFDGGNGEVTGVGADVDATTAHAYTAQAVAALTGHAHHPGVTGSADAADTSTGPPWWTIAAALIAAGAAAVWWAGRTPRTRHE